MKKLGVIGIMLLYETNSIKLVQQDDGGMYDLQPIQTNELEQNEVELYSDILADGKAPNLEELKPKKKK